jgi:16S rRNA G966 N2-methylase RsmD
MAENPTWKRLEHGYLKPWFRRMTRPLKPLRALRPIRSVNYAGIEVHYRPHLDGGGRTFGQDFIPLLRARGMPKQNRCFEWCAGPGFIGFSMLGHGLCDTLCLADINPEAVRVCEQTIAAGGLGNRVAVYQSDNLAALPASEQWDLVVSNPPHFADEFAGRLRCHDPDWSIHRGFFRTVGAHLKPGGVIVLQENNSGSTAETFRQMIEEAGLTVVFVDRCQPERTAVSHFYYIGIMRAADAPPAWADPARG